MQVNYIHGRKGLYSAVLVAVRVLYACAGSAQLSEEHMTPTGKHDAATEALRQHELKHMKIQREYNASLAKLELLSRAAEDAWREMMVALEASVAGQGGLKP